MDSETSKERATPQVPFTLLIFSLHKCSIIISSVNVPLIIIKFSTL